MRRALASLAVDARGSAAIEYSLIVAGIALALLTALMSASDKLLDLYASIAAGVATLAGL